MGVVLVLAIGLVCAGSVVLTGTASAANPIQMQYGNKTPGWHVISTDGAYGYFGSDGWYTGRWMTGSAFGKMAGRFAYGVQSLGTGVGSGYSSNAVNGASVAAQLKTVATGAGTIATVRSLKGDTMGLMARLKSWGTLKTLGTVALAATSFEVGWKIGSVVADVFGFGQDGPPPSEGGGRYEASQQVFYDVGEEIKSSGVKAPQPGARVDFKPIGGAGLFTEMRPYGVEESGGKCQFDRVGLLPEHSTFIQSVFFPVFSTTCSGTKFNLTNGVFFVPLLVSHLPGEPGGSPTKTITGSPQSPSNSSSATKTAEECLAGAIFCGNLPGWWWNHDPEAKAETNTVGARLGLDPADPLSLQIPTPEVGEKYGHYDERLEALELVPEPAVLAESQISPDAGPEGVVATVPHIGSNVEPGAHVQVRYNPASAPNTAEEEGISESSGSSGWSPPAIPAIDMSPLAGIPSPCDAFPFGLFCWLGEALGQFNTTGVCPHFSAPVAGTESDFAVTLCGETSETIMGYLRPAILLAFIVGLGFMFSRGTKAVGGGD